MVKGPNAAMGTLVFVPHERENLMDDSEFPSAQEPEAQFNVVEEQVGSEIRRYPGERFSAKQQRRRYSKIIHILQQVMPPDFLPGDHSSFKINSAPTNRAPVNVI